MALHVNIMTLFPEWFPGPLGESLAGKALQEGAWSMHVEDIRAAAGDKRGTVDDRPFGGGAGMVMMPDVLERSYLSLDTARHNKHKFIYMSPRGKHVDQAYVDDLLTHDAVTFLCGRFEGVDQRFLDHYDVEELSIGDFILSGGEIAAMAVIDACVRKIFGVLSNPLTHDEESFAVDNSSFLLEYPHFTRPAMWQGKAVPEVLTSGNHEKIHEWRLLQSQELTEKRRKDLWQHYQQEQAAHNDSEKK